MNALASKLIEHASFDGEVIRSRVGAFEHQVRNELYHRHTLQAYRGQPCTACIRGLHLALQGRCTC